MSFPIVRKKSPVFGENLNISNYKATCEKFDWQQTESNIIKDKDVCNMAYLAVDSNVDQGFGDQIAIRWLSKKQGSVDISYRSFSDQTNQFANVLQSLGIKKGDRIFGLAGRVPYLYIALIGSLKNGSVFSPLFSAFGPEPIQSRMTIGQANVLITSEKLYLKKIASWRDELPSLKHVLLFDIKKSCPENCQDLSQLMAEASTEFQLCETHAEDLALLHFTSGTTGKPKGAMHVHGAVVHHIHSGYCALDLKPNDIYWCTADPGWVTGTSYGIISPLCHRVTLIIDEAEFDVQRWYSILQDQKVTVWYTAPTAIRMLMKAGYDLVKNYDLTSLRFISSVGEPLNPEAVIWSLEAFGKPFHDNWWQTETGGIMIANFASEDIKPGSMGQPLPGIQVAILDENHQPVHGDNIPGELAIKKGWPSMFRGYLNETERYEKSFYLDWYLTGDMAMCDTDGYFWFVGRANDLIKSSGHLIGPFEVESALIEHPAVAEAGVIGIPDDVSGEMVKAFVALNPGFSANEELHQLLIAHARKKLGPSIAPREIAFRQNLPKTRSGKIMRRLLKSRELGLPEGDISTLESDEKD